MSEELVVGNLWDQFLEYLWAPHLLTWLVIIWATSLVVVSLGACWTITRGGCRNGTETLSEEDSDEEIWRHIR